MANETLTDVFSDIADAVRAKGVTGQMTPLQMPAKITSIPSGSGSDAKLFEADLELNFTGLTAIPNNPSGSNDAGRFAYWLNLKSASFPDLTSVGAYGCYKMFYNCTSLTTAPALPTTLAESCYASMFYGCSSLTTAPVLPATTLAKNCYNSMFYGCTSLTIAPSLPATTLTTTCYANMFTNCTSLTTAPELPATTLTLGCYQNMFRGCSSLTTAPSISATTLAKNCYASMFQDCNSLTTAPTLIAATLAESCYGGMFFKCTSLTGTITIPVLNTNTSIPNNAFNNMFQNCTNLTKVILDFSTFSSIPTLGAANSINVFNSTSDARLEIHVPSALEADWETASNWSNWASFIVGV